MNKLCSIFDKECRLLEDNIDCNINDSECTIDIKGQQLKITNIIDMGLSLKDSISWNAYSLIIEDKEYYIILVQETGGDQNHLEVYVNLKI